MAVGTRTSSLVDNGSDSAWLAARSPATVRRRIAAEVLGARAVTAADVVVIQRNPRAGNGCRDRVLLQFIRRLKELGWRVRLFKHRQRMDAWLADAENHRRTHCVVAAGGDGTIRDLVSRHANLPIGVLPLGTENVLAQNLRMPRDGRRLAEIISAGQTRRLDVGLVGDQIFLLMVGVGLDGMVIHRVHKQRRGRITHGNYVWPGLQTLLITRRPQVQVELENGQTVCGEQAIVSNFPGYGMRLKFSPLAGADDGRLDLRLFRRLGIGHTAWHLLEAWWRGVSHGPNVVTATGTKFVITSEQPVPVQADGDPVGMTPVTVTIQPGACRVIVP